MWHNYDLLIHFNFISNKWNSGHWTLDNRQLMSGRSDSPYPQTTTNGCGCVDETKPKWIRTDGGGERGDECSGTVSVGEVYRNKHDNLYEAAGVVCQIVFVIGIWQAVEFTNEMDKCIQSAMKMHWLVTLGYLYTHRICVCASNKFD